MLGVPLQALVGWGLSQCQVKPRPSYEVWESIWYSQLPWKEVTLPPTKIPKWGECASQTPKGAWLLGYQKRMTNIYN